MLTDHLHRQDVSLDFSLPSELSPALFPKGQSWQALGPSVQIRPQREQQLPRVDSSECSGGGGQSTVYPVEVVAANLVPLWFWAAVVGDVSNERAIDTSVFVRVWGVQVVCNPLKRQPHPALVNSLIPRPGCYQPGAITVNGTQLTVHRLKAIMNQDPTTCPKPKKPWGLHFKWAWKGTLPKTSAAWRVRATGSPARSGLSRLSAARHRDQPTRDGEGPGSVFVWG